MEIGHQLAGSPKGWDENFIKLRLGRYKMCPNQTFSGPRGGGMDVCAAECLRWTESNPTFVAQTSKINKINLFIHLINCICHLSTRGVLGTTKRVPALKVFI